MRDQYHRAVFVPNIFKHPIYRCEIGPEESLRDSGPNGDGDEQELKRRLQVPERGQDQTEPGQLIVFRLGSVPKPN